MDAQLSAGTGGTVSPIIHECHHTGAPCGCGNAHPGYDRRANLLAVFRKAVWNGASDDELAVLIAEAAEALS
jgi:hypothetical protein